MTAPRSRRPTPAQATAESIAGRTRIIRDTRLEILAQLDEALKQITLALANAPSDAAHWSLASLQREIRRALDEFATDAAGIAGPGAAQAYQAGLDLIDNALAAGGVSVAAFPQAINTVALGAMRSFFTDKLKAVALDAADKINTQLGLTMMGAQTPFQAVKAIAEILGGDARDRATVIVRTELGRAFSVASFERMGEAARHVPGLKKQWRRSGKVHSRWNHDLVDGQVREAAKPFEIPSKYGTARLMHPHDPKAPARETINCGCVMLPWMEGWKMGSPGRKPFTAEEIAQNPIKADLEAVIRKRGGG